MPDRWKPLGDLAVGDRAMLPVQLTAKSGSGATLATLTRNAADGSVTQTGAIQIAAPAGTIAGAFTIDPRNQPMFTQQLGLAVGDLLMGPDGVVLVARQVGLGPDNTLWSPYPAGTAGQPARSQAGYTVVGHITPP